MKKIFTLIVMAAMTLPMFAHDLSIGLYSNEWVAGNWNGYAETVTSSLIGLREGDKIQVTVISIESTVDYPSVSLSYKDANGDLTDFSEDEVHAVRLFGESASEESPFIAEITMTASMVKKVLAGQSLLVRGSGYTGSSVSLVRTYDDDLLEEVDLTKPMTNCRNASYDSETKTMTWTKAGGECGWSYGEDKSEEKTSRDCSCYKEVVYELAGTTPAGGTSEAAYVVDGSESSDYYKFSSGVTVIIYTFDDTKSSHVKSVYLKLSDVGSIKLNKVYFVKNETAAINNVNAVAVSTANRKVVENGRVVIFKNGKKYGASGQLLK